MRKWARAEQEIRMVMEKHLRPGRYTVNDIWTAFRGHEEFSKHWSYGSITQVFRKITLELQAIGMAEPVDGFAWLIRAKPMGLINTRTKIIEVQLKIPNELSDEDVVTELKEMFEDASFEASFNWSKRVKYYRAKVNSTVC